MSMDVLLYFLLVGKNLALFFKQSKSVVSLKRFIAYLCLIMFGRCFHQAMFSSGKVQNQVQQFISTQIVFTVIKDNKIFFLLSILFFNIIVMVNQMLSKNFCKMVQHFNVTQTIKPHCLLHLGQANYIYFFMIILVEIS